LGGRQLKTLLQHSKGPLAQHISAATAQCIGVCTVGELFGGVERHVLGLLISLQTRGIRTLLILFHEGELAIQARAQGIEPVILSDRNSALLTTSRRLAQIFRQSGVTVVHAHGYKATVFCALARGWHRFALVKTEHGLPEPMAAGLIHTWRNRLYSSLDIVATRISGATVCYVTEDLRASYRKAHSGLPTTVISNGVERMDRRQFPRPAEMREGWFNLLVVGRLDTVKGHHFAVEALAADSLSPEAHLHLLGLGPREQQLRELSESLGVAHRVHILGFRRNVYDYIANCNALLMPSLHEGLPYTLLEAMALGTPIIASRVGGLAEVMKDTGAGLLVPPRDVKALGQAIRKLHDNPTLRAQLGDLARQLQRSKYSLEAMTDRYIALYRGAGADIG
jgi:glycosyltransferase involved in cell wall biosynthesis